MTVRIYRVLEVFTDLVYLNLLWMVTCLPVVTIAPATAAMFGVVRGWIKGKDVPTTGEFFSLFRENFGRSLVVGLVRAVLGAVLAADILLIGQGAFFRRPCTRSSSRSLFSTSRLRFTCSPSWSTTRWAGRL